MRRRKSRSGRLSRISSPARAVETLDNVLDTIRDPEAEFDDRGRGGKGPSGWRGLRGWPGAPPSFERATSLPHSPRRSHRRKSQHSSKQPRTTQRRTAPPTSPRPPCWRARLRRTWTTWFRAPASRRNRSHSWPRISTPDISKSSEDTSDWQGIRKFIKVTKDAFEKVGNDLDGDTRLLVGAITSLIESIGPAMDVESGLNCSCPVTMQHAAETVMEGGEFHSSLAGQRSGWR